MADQRQQRSRGLLAEVDDITGRGIGQRDPGEVDRAFVEHRVAGYRRSNMAPTPEIATLRDLLETQAMRLGDRPFLTLPDAKLTYAETDELANKTANVLINLGYGEGDIVTSRCPNGWALTATWLACNKIGAVFLPINALLSGQPLLDVMSHSGSAVVVCDASLWDQLAAIRDRLPQLRHVLLTGGPAQGGTLDLDRLLDGARSSAPAPLTPNPAAPTKLMYTSGTTGVPKGVLWSRRCELVWAQAYGEECLPISEGEALYSCLPLFHITCQGTILAALWNGGRVTIDSGFNLLSFWNRVRDADAVMFTFVGTILSALARRPESAADADNPVRRILGAAAPVDRWRDIERRFDLVIAETWGQTETASCWSWPGRGLPQTPGTVGVPSARWEAQIVDGDGRALDPGQPGELLVRPLADHVMFEGYLGPDGPQHPTRESWDVDGWYHTGDLLSWTDDGELTFVGRHRDAIRRAGEMISPSFVEEAAITHPQIVEAAAIGVPADDGVEEEILVCVVAAEGDVLDLGEVAAFLATCLPKFLVPRWIRIVDELPKTPTTRVRKFQLRELGTSGAWDTRRRRFSDPVADAGPPRR
ncbi:MAG: ATP-dependent acyl-CoA ligase [Acidimicrobiales bacterium]